MPFDPCPARHPGPTWPTNLNVATSARVRQSFGPHVPVHKLLNTMSHKQHLIMLLAELAFDVCCQFHRKPKCATFSHSERC